MSYRGAKKPPNPSGPDPNLGSRTRGARVSAPIDWSDPSRTDIIQKPSGRRSVDGQWGHFTDRDDEKTEVYSYFSPFDDEATVRVPPELAEALVSSTQPALRGNDEQPAFRGNDEPTVVDGPRPPPVEDLSELSDEATEVDSQPPYADAWLPKPPRIPSEFARTAPRSTRLVTPVHPRHRARRARIWKLVAGGLFVSGMTLFTARSTYDAEFRARVHESLRPLRERAHAGLSALFSRSDDATAKAPQTAPVTPRDAPAASAPAANTRGAEGPGVRPAQPSAGAAEPANAIPTVRIEDLPLLPECEGSCEDEDATTPNDRRERERERRRR